MCVGVGGGGVGGGEMRREGEGRGGHTVNSARSDEAALQGRTGQYGDAPAEPP